MTEVQWLTRLCNVKQLPGISLQVLRAVLDSLPVAPRVKQFVVDFERKLHVQCSRQRTFISADAASTGRRRSGEKYRNSDCRSYWFYFKVVALHRQMQLYNSEQLDDAVHL